MRYIVLIAALGCGGNLADGEVTEPPIVISVEPDKFSCRLSGEACECTIPAYSSEAIAEMSTRCHFLRDVGDDLY